MKTGAELKARRLELGITQHDLAGNAGISRTQLSRMENGKIEIPVEIRPILYDLLYAKHEKPKLQFSDLEVGDYVYVRDDLIEFKDYGCTYYVDEIGSGIQQIESFHSEDSQFITNKSHYWVTPEMIDLSRSMKKEEYLKMNEEEDTYTLENVIDIATQAVKDKVIYKAKLINLNGNVALHWKSDINIKKDEVLTEKSWRKFDSVISYIKSLYTEEFVIECEDDVKRIKSNAKIILMNGIECNSIIDNDKIKIHDGGIFYYPARLLILKGAMVKQSK